MAARGHNAAMEALDALRHAQAATDTSNAELARACGVSRQSVTNMYARDVDPRVSTFAAMCAAMGCRVELVTPEGERLPIDPPGRV